MNISIDDVLTKRQEAERKKKSDTTLDAPKKIEKKKRKSVYNTIVHIENPKGQYTLTGLGVSTIINFLVAFLIHNGLLEQNWIFFLDGQRSLYTTLLERLSWHGNITFILDWYHLKKKCEMQLSLGLNDRKKRNKILGKILYYSWYGLSEKVYEVIDNIPEEYIKNQKALDKLKGYYERNYYYIPN